LNATTCVGVGHWTPNSMRDVSVHRLYQYFKVKINYLLTNEFNGLVVIGD